MTANIIGLVLLVLGFLGALVLDSRAARRLLEDLKRAEWETFVFWGVIATWSIGVVILAMNVWMV